MEDGQCAEPWAIGELVGDEVQAPDVISSAAVRRCSRWTAVAWRQGRFRRSVLDVQPIDPLIPDLPAFSPQQHEQPAIAEARTTSSRSCFNSRASLGSIAPYDVLQR